MEIAEQYITKEFLEGHLKEGVDSFSIQSGSNAGDNYTSILYSIDVILKAGKKIFLLLKVFPYHPARQDFLKMVNIFSKEVSAYSIWIPALKKLDPNFKLPFAPFLGGQAVDFKAPGADKTKTGFLDNYILMTDIRKTYGYTMTDRRKGLDFEHTKLVLKELGKIHAMSWVYMQKNGTEVLGDTFPFLNDEMFNDEMAEQFAPMMEGVLNKAINHIKDELGNDSVVVAGIEALINDSKLSTERMQQYLALDGIDEEKAESWMRVPPPRDSSFNKTPWRLGCHGDCWVNNMLFRYKNDGIPEEVVLVDLQIYRQACPTTDLAYLLVSSVPFQVRTKHEAEFMEIYYKSFIATCEHFSVAPMPGFTLATLKRRYRRAKIFGFYMGIPLLNIVLKDPEDAIDMDKMGDSAKNMVDMFENILIQQGGEKKDVHLQKQYAGLAQELYDDGII